MKRATSKVQEAFEQVRRNTCSRTYRASHQVPLLEQVHKPARACAAAQEHGPYVQSTQNTLPTTINRLICVSKVAVCVGLAASLLVRKARVKQSGRTTLQVLSAVY